MLERVPEGETLWVFQNCPELLENACCLTLLARMSCPGTSESVNLGF